jgi:tetratricopeptide (TPR) repeat protein
MHKLFLALVVLYVSLPCQPQTPSAQAVAKAEAPVSSYSDEAVVVEHDDAVYRFAADGTGSKRETTVLRMQSSAALQTFGVLSFPYASGNQQLDLVYVRVRKPDGSVVETPVSDAQDQPAQVTQMAPMYSDLHLKQIPVRSLAVGDKLEFQVLLTLQQPEAPGEFWGKESFGAGAVYLSRTIELRVPKQKPLTVYSPDYKPEISEAGEERVYRWSGAQLRSTAAKPDEDVPQDKKLPIQWTTFPSWAAVGEWYRGVIAGRDAVTPAIKAKADELTASAKTDTEKVRALYEYVSTHNHYIGIDFGIGRYQPHAASEVMTNQYGDCKDKHTLLAALLRAEGFTVSPALISTGAEMNEKVPTPAAFNHLITVVQVDGAPVWLDATTEVAPYRALPALLRDKQALVIPATGAAQLEKTPAQLPFPAVTHFEAKAELDKSGLLKGHVEMTMRGDDEIYMRYAARQTARTQWDQLSQTYLNGTGWKGTASGTLFDSPEDTSVPFRFRYDVSQSPYGDWPNFRIGSFLPRLNLPAIDEKKPPKQDINLGSPHTFIAESIIHLPEGYSAELPNAIHHGSDFATFDRTYALKNGSLVSEYKLETLTDKVPALAWKVYKKFLDEINHDPWIQLTATESVPGVKGPPLAGENNLAAATLVREAHAELNAKDKDMERIHKKLDEAAAINDKQRFLWTAFGYLAVLEEKFDVVVTDYRRELKLYPDEIRVYPALIDAQGRTGDKAGERESLLAYAKAAPTTDSVILWVANRLLATDNVADAVDVYRAGMKDIPDNKVIQAELGRALLRAGKADEGVAVEKAALEGSSDADVLNDGAYALASAHVELPLAESYARKVVELLETESTQTKLTSADDQSFRCAVQLLAAWDTLGWIYFSEGKMDLAEQYVAAAWKNGAHAETGLHLGQILEKRGAQVPAMQTYELALSGRTESAAPSVATELQARINALKKLGVASQYPHPADVLQERRTYRIPRAKGMMGSAIFLMQVSPARTETVEMTGGGDALRGQGEALAHLDLKLAVPQNSHALLLRSGLLFCLTEKTCEFVLTPPESANVKLAYGTAVRAQ